MIRLNLGSHPPRFRDAEGRAVHLEVSRGETVIHHQVRYKDEVCVNLIGTWAEGCAEPLWVMTDLKPEHGLQLYRARLKIEASFRDLKNVLGMTRVMSKRQDYMEKMLALLLLVYAIGLLVGESLRDALYGQPVAHPPSADASTSQPRGNKWRRYSGLFVLLKQKWHVSPLRWRAILNAALSTFLAIVHPPVPT